MAKARRSRKTPEQIAQELAEAAAAASAQVPQDAPMPSMPDTRQFGRTASMMERIAALTPRTNLESPANQRILRILEAIQASRAARMAGREGQGLSPEATLSERENAATMRDPLIANSEGRSNPRSWRRSTKAVVIGGKSIELPEDYAERKKFRKYRMEALHGVKPRSKQDRITEAQLRGRLGRAGRAAGLAVGSATARLPKVPMPTARNPLVRFGLRYGRNIGGTRGALMGLGALGGGALVGGLVREGSAEADALERDREDLRRRARQDILDLVGRREYKESVQMGIEQNLARLQANAPDLYMRAAAGRILPQGAVVIGGVPRTDLLNELGMAMSNGQFGQ